MIKNLKVTAWMLSPLCGDAPMIDSLLEYELACRLGMKHARKLTRDIPLSQIERVPIPLAQRTIAGKDIYCCSNPILGEQRSEWVEHLSKRFESVLLASFVHDSQLKKVMTASGPFKNRFAPLRIRLIDRVCWFVRGDQKEINKLLKKIPSLGHLRNIGYGRIDRWEYEDVTEDNSIFAMHKGQKVLMKTIPFHFPEIEKVKGYFRSYAGAYPPYWHPETYGEVAIPC